MKSFDFEPSTSRNNIWGLGTRRMSSDSFEISHGVGYHIIVFEKTHLTGCCVGQLYAHRAALTTVSSHVDIYTRLCPSTPSLPLVFYYCSMSIECHGRNGDRCGLN